MGKPSEVIIVGGGITGSSIAYHLARRGTEVLVLEQGDIPYAASSASAGGVRQQGRDLRELPLAIASIKKWEYLEDELEADVHYRREGHLRVVESEDDLPEVYTWMENQEGLGLDLQLLQGSDLSEIAPGLAPEVVAGTYSPTDGHANPILATKAFANAAARFKADIRTGVRVIEIKTVADRVVGVETTSGEFSCDVLILATGAWTAEMCSGIGIEIPVLPRAPQMIVTTPLPLELSQVVGSLRRRLSLKQIPSGNYVIGGGWPGEVKLDEHIAVPLPESIVGSLVDSSAVYPVLSRSAVERVWVGIEGQTPDEIPVLGEIPNYRNLLTASGFSGHGFAIGPIIGQLISELVVDGKPSMDISEFRFDRFSGMEGQEWWPTLRAG